MLTHESAVLMLAILFPVFQVMRYCSGTGSRCREQPRRKCTTSFWNPRRSLKWKLLSQGLMGKTDFLCEMLNSHFGIVVRYTATIVWLFCTVWPIWTLITILRLLCALFWLFLILKWNVDGNCLLYLKDLSTASFPITSWERCIERISKYIRIVDIVTAMSYGSPSLRPNPDVTPNILDLRETLIRQVPSLLSTHTSLPCVGMNYRPLTQHPVCVLVCVFPFWYKQTYNWGIVCAGTLYQMGIGDGCWSVAIAEVCADVWCNLPPILQRHTKNSRNIPSSFRIE